MPTKSNAYIYQKKKKGKDFIPCKIVTPKRWRTTAGMTEL